MVYKLPKKFYKITYEIIAVKDERYYAYFYKKPTAAEAHQAFERATGYSARTLFGMTLERVNVNV